MLSLFFVSVCARTEREREGEGCDAAGPASGHGSACRKGPSSTESEALTRPPLTAGFLQHTLQDTAQTAAMAALLCTTAGWPYLATLCESLSKQAAAGGRTELLPLLQVAGIEPSRARALYQAGLKTPLEVLDAGEEAVKAALSAALPRSMQRMGGKVEKGTLAAAQVRCFPLPITQHVAAARQTCSVLASELDGMKQPPLQVCMRAAVNGGPGAADRAGSGHRMQPAAAAQRANSARGSVPACV